MTDERTSGPATASSSSASAKATMSGSTSRRDPPLASGGAARAQWLELCRSRAPISSQQPVGHGGPRNSGGSTTRGGGKVNVELGAAGGSDDVLSDALGHALRARGVGENILYLAREVASWAPDASVTERRSLAGLTVALLEAVEAGSTLLAWPNDPARGHAALASDLARLGFSPSTDETAAICELADQLRKGAAPSAMADLFGPPGSRRPFVLNAEGLYLERLWTVEDDLARRIRAHLDGGARRLSAARDARAAAARLASAVGRPLTGEQEAAVGACLDEPITIITGGPGTGKTSVVVALVRALVAAGLSPEQIALCAPTGRAAQRIDESVRAGYEVRTPRGGAASPTVHGDVTGLPAARTLHRLLGHGRARAAGLDGEHLTHGPRFPLPYDAVIVDEASMIDLFLMRSLVAALAAGTRLVLLGDADQLPSIRAGAVFADLCRALPERSVIRLTRSHRMSPADPAGAEILRVAGAANRGELPGDAMSARASPDELRGEAVEHLPSGQLAAFVERWYRALRARVAATGASDLVVYDCSSGGRLTGGDRAVEALLAAHSAERVLCVTRRGFAGRSADELNAAFHAHARAETRGIPVPRLGIATAGFTPGEPVMVLRNDYRRGLFNGDQGLVLRVRGPDTVERLGVAFQQADGVRVFPLAELAVEMGIGLAFAVTVHKAQGSELDRAALILPKEDLPLLSRELVYTALSRARRNVVIVGDPDVLTLAVGRSLPRRSGLPARLQR